MFEILIKDYENENITGKRKFGGAHCSTSSHSPSFKSSHSIQCPGRILKLKIQHTDLESWDLEGCRKSNCPNLADYTGKLYVKWWERSSSPQIMLLYLNSQWAEVGHLQVRLSRRCQKDSGAGCRSKPTYTKGSWWLRGDSRWVRGDYRKRRKRSLLWEAISRTTNVNKPPKRWLEVPISCIPCQESNR